MDVDNRQLRCVTNLHVASARPEAPSTPRAEKRVRPWPARLPVAALALAKTHHGSAPYAVADVRRGPVRTLRFVG